LFDIGLPLTVKCMRSSGFHGKWPVHHHQSLLDALSFDLPIHPLLLLYNVVGS